MNNSRILSTTLLLVLTATVCADDSKDAKKEGKPLQSLLVKEIKVEANASLRRTLDRYSFDRTLTGSMTLKVVHGLAGPVLVNDPTAELAGIIDHALANPNHHKPTFYVVTPNKAIGIDIRGKLVGATGPTGQPLTEYWFIRYSDGTHLIVLREGTRLYGGRNLPWEVSLAIVQAASDPNSATIKVIKTAEGSTLLMVDRVFPTTE